MSYFDSAYKALKQIFTEGKYIKEVLPSIAYSEDKNLVTRLIYGVIEKNTELEYKISVLSKKSPQKAVGIVLKIGLYCLAYMDSIPNYAVCNNAVKLVKDIGKSGASSYVNATLKKSIGFEFPLPQKKEETLSVVTSKPLWITKKILKQYPDFAQTILSYQAGDDGHVRVNKNKSSLDEVCNLLDQKGQSYRLSEEGGIYLKDSDTVRKLFDKGIITYQSPSSIKIAELAVSSQGKKILDMCAAPGGKSVYMQELTKGEVTALDLHPHRVGLIKSYANRMGVNLSTFVCDGREIKEEFLDRFDNVLCDAPCSGIGTIYSKPDIMLFRKECDIPDLCALQEELLNNGALYVKKGGYLTYSTCTLFYEENERVVERFLSTHTDFVVDMPQEFLERGEKYMKRLPGIDGPDGFFAVRMRRI